MAKPIHAAFYTEVTELARRKMTIFCSKHNENIKKLRAIAESIPEEDKIIIKNDHNLAWYYKEYETNFCNPKAVYALLLNDFCKTWWDNRDRLKDEDFKDPEVLLAGVSAAGLDAAAAREVLNSDAHSAEVRERQQFYAQAGIHSVPAIIINDKHLISGGQPVAVFEQALRRIASGEVS